jgi:hypothetical protein
MQSGGTGRIQGPWQSGSSGTHGILDENNIWYDWGTSGLNDEGSPDGHGAANTFSNPKSNLAGTTGETFVGSGVFYPRPGTSGADGTNSVGSYHATLGQTATTDAFLAIAANQCKNNWNTNYTTYAVVNYLKGGFGIFVSQGHKNLKADI